MSNRAIRDLLSYKGQSKERLEAHTDQLHPRPSVPRQVHGGFYALAASEVIFRQRTVILIYKLSQSMTALMKTRTKPTIRTRCPTQTETV